MNSVAHVRQIDVDLDVRHPAGLRQAERIESRVTVEIGALRRGAGVGRRRRSVKRRGDVGTLRQPSQERSFASARIRRHGRGRHGVRRQDRDGQLRRGPPRLDDKRGQSPQRHKSAGTVRRAAVPRGKRRWLSRRAGGGWSWRGFEFEESCPTSVADVVRCPFRPRLVTNWCARLNWPYGSPSLAARCFERCLVHSGQERMAGVSRSRGVSRRRGNAGHRSDTARLRGAKVGEVFGRATVG